MIQRIIDEINIALENQLYLLALSAALTLPDVCGKAEYPNDRTTARYKKWYSNYVKDGNIPEEQVYKLRCSLLHEGNTDVEIKDNTRFILMTNQFTQSLGIDFCFNEDVTHADGSHEKEIKVYVGYLCTAICKAAQKYYRDNKGKFSFLNYEICELATIL